MTDAEKARRHDKIVEALTHEEWKLGFCPVCNSGEFSAGGRRHFQGCWLGRALSRPCDRPVHREEPRPLIYVDGKPVNVEPEQGDLFAQAAK